MSRTAAAAVAALTRPEEEEEEEEAGGQPRGNQVSLLEGQNPSTSPSLPSCGRLIFLKPLFQASLPPFPSLFSSFLAAVEILNHLSAAYLRRTAAAAGVRERVLVFASEPQPWADASSLSIRF